MSGFIRKREVFLHPLPVVRAFGFRFFLRCLVAPKGSTYLGLLTVNATFWGQS